MPRFGLTRTLTLQNGSIKTCLEIILTENEELSDEFLNMVDPFVSHLSVTREQTMNSQTRLMPINFMCRRGAFGRFNQLESLCVFGTVGLLDDSVFEGCTRLKYLYMGASEYVLFEKNSAILSSLPLSEIHLNGFGIVKVGAGLQAVIDRVRQRYGEESVRYYY